MSPTPDLENLTALDPEGETIALGSLWRDRPVVLAFVRHFG